MKICYLANAASGHTNRWANYFIECGWEVHLITWRPPGGSTRLDLDVHVHRIFFPPHYASRYGALAEIMMMLRKISPDIIHAHNLSHFGILGGLYGMLTGFKPLVITAWGSDVLMDARFWRGKLIKSALKKADYLTCQGENVAREMINLGADPGKIEIIRFGVDTDQFRPLPGDENLKKELNIVGSQTVISSRAFEPVYDVESLIRAIPYVVEKLPGTRFLILGRGSLEKHLHALSAISGIDNYIRWIGRVPRDELPGYNSIADLYVSTSLSDSGFAISNAEAMACGLPVVITDIADTGEWIEDGKNGYITPVKNPKILAEKIITALEDRNFLSGAGRFNRQLIEEKFNYRTEMEKVKTRYEELLRAVSN